MTTKILKTGLIGRFIKIIEKRTDQAVLQSLQRLMKEADTYCPCGLVGLKQFFEAAPERTVEVDLKQSCIPGTPSCEFVTHI
jgi:hypothetical protein